MNTQKNIYVCSENAKYRGFFKTDPKKTEQILGYIENQKGEKTFVKKTKVSLKLLESRSEFNFITTQEVNDTRNRKIIEIKDFFTVTDTDSSGHFVCGI